jgi:hypothetical protein
MAHRAIPAPHRARQRRRRDSRRTSPTPCTAITCGCTRRATELGFATEASNDLGSIPATHGEGFSPRRPDPHRVGARDTRVPSRRSRLAHRDEIAGRSTEAHTRIVSAPTRCGITSTASNAGLAERPGRAPSRAKSCLPKARPADRLRALRMTESSPPGPRPHPGARRSDDGSAPRGAYRVAPPDVRGAARIYCCI